jgi:hypothetical protein
VSNKAPTQKEREDQVAQITSSNIKQKVIYRGGEKYLRESPESDIQRLRKKARSKQKHKPGSDQNKPTCWKNSKMRRKPNKLAKESGKSKQQQTKNKHFHNLRDPYIIASLAQSLFLPFLFLPFCGSFREPGGPETR